VLPSWWPAKQGGVNFEFKQMVECPEEVERAVQHLFDMTWKAKATRDRHDSKTVLRLKVVKVEQNMNHRLWANYYTAREEVREQMKKKLVRANPAHLLLSHKALTSEGVSKEPILGELDKSVNEFLLFHGTKRSAVEGICHSDFRLNLAGSHRGTLYGKGIYFADSCSKSDEYSEVNAPDDPDEHRTMLLCRVVCGRMWYTDAASVTDLEKSSFEKDCKDTDGQIHSVLGDREKATGTYKEYVVFNNDLAYPEFVITYKRTYD
jgi:hypothetical protein